LVFKKRFADKKKFDGLKLVAGKTIACFPTFHDAIALNFAAVLCNTSIDRPNTNSK